MARRAASALSGVLLALTLAAPLSAQGPGVQVAKVTFAGNHTFDDATLSYAIATNSGECKTLAVLCKVGIGQEPYYFDEPTLRADVLRLRIFYYEHGFRDAQVSADTTARKSRVAVTFHIKEGRPVRVSEITINGLDVPGAAGVGRNLLLKKGDAFDVRLYDAMRDTLVARLKNRGYPNAQALAGYDIRNAQPYDVSVRYNVLPGVRARFGAVDVQGARTVSDRVVERMLSFRPGDLYDRSAILQSQRDLFSLQVFRRVDIQPDLNAAPDSVVPVTVRVNEGPTRSVHVGAGLNQAECLTAEGRWQSRNFLGGARQLGVRARVSNLLADQVTSFPCDQTGSDPYSRMAGLFSVDFVQPFFFGPANNAGAGIIMERRSVPNIFVRTARGGYLSLTRRLGHTASISLAYRPELTKLEADDLFLCTSFVGCAYNELEVLRQSNLLAPVTLSYIVDRSNDIFSPTGGHVLRTDLEYAASYTGSKFAYARWSAEGSAYRGIGRSVLALHLRAGVARDLGHDGELGLNPQKRFFAGGANSVRGFRQFALGPEALTVDGARYLLPPDSAGGAGCAPAAVNDGTCDASPLASGVFQVRPTGGEAVLEGSVELRFPAPIWQSKLRAAVFVDAGQVWRKPDELKLSQIVATPGVGIRYQSPVGPIRLDIAFNTQGVQRLPVLTTQVCEIQQGGPCPPINGQDTGYRNTDVLVQLRNPVDWSAYSRPADTLPGFFQRLRVHFSIGQAF
ncbi:MAG TPA: BamA/TamA family outer membrane protein [Longimicrobiales bacterium]|nr:BamA/TamA family outer membrane protein [Longimicrobiales bacterium]